MAAAKETLAEQDKVDTELLKQIDAIQLSERLRREREQFFKREVEITADRTILVLEWWQETEADVMDIRWAKLVQKLAERRPIAIFKGQLAAGHETSLFRGANLQIEADATLLENMEVGQMIRQSAGRALKCVNDEDWKMLTEAFDFFLGKTPVDVLFKNMRSMYGDWPEEFERARGFYRPGRNSAPPAPMWEKLLTKGLRGIIEEAEAGIEKVRCGEEPDAEKAWFWQAVIIACEAIIHYAHRYAKLARDIAQDEPDPTRRRELEQMAENCERVPEYPARTLHDAVQSKIIYSLGWKLSRPNFVCDSLRMDQYFYPYFISDIREHRLTLEEAAELIGTSLSNQSRQDGVVDISAGMVVQGVAPNNLTLGGLTSEGKDAYNELTYLILHMQGLLKYAEPHYTFRVNAGTPKWALMKALETNRKVGGGQPQFMSDDHVIGYLVKQGESLEDARDWGGYG